MIKQITIAAVLGASVAFYIYAEFNDSPGDTQAGQVHSHNNPMSQQPAASSNDPEQAVISDDSTEIVLGLRVRKDRNCRIELKDYVTPDGAMFAAYSCSPDSPAAKHVYDEYDNKTLATMAYADADAAALLGHRLIDKDTHRSYQLLIRASALDGGNVEHLAWLAEQAFGAVAINGEPQLANLQRQYELAALATRLGDAAGKTDYLKTELIRFGVNEEQLYKLDLRVDALLQSMRAIQRTVLGEVTIGGQDDA
jgi:hypothetical protein